MWGQRGQSKLTDFTDSRDKERQLETHHSDSENNDDRVNMKATLKEMAGSYRQWGECLPLKHVMPHRHHKYDIHRGVVELVRVSVGRFLCRRVNGPVLAIWQDLSHMELTKEVGW